MSYEATLPNTYVLPSGGVYIGIQIVILPKYFPDFFSIFWLNPIYIEFNFGAVESPLCAKKRFWSVSYIQSGASHSITSSWHDTAINLLLLLRIALEIAREVVLAHSLFTTEVNSSNAIISLLSRRHLARSTLIFSPLLNTLYGLSQLGGELNPTEVKVFSISLILALGISSITGLSVYSYPAK